MAHISLRLYIREIEGIIDHGQYDQAIAHCKYILISFPKLVDIYRLLGKSYLEGQRYHEASDIFQRVLSVLPDDFVAQIGMSIIREDEGNLDAAIFHMERAFEVQPSTSTVQDELRRLYGKRDGAAPPKVRLTRGALVRMYARSELYPQAIAEIRAALAETPERVDLEVILAKMYYLSGQKSEAAELAGKLIEKLPFCYEANKILSDIVSNSPQTKDLDIYQNRLNSIDPYAAYISPSTPMPSDIPESAVMIEKMQTDENPSDSSKPAWSQISKVSDSEIKRSEPDWLSEEEKEDSQQKLPQFESDSVNNIEQPLEVFQEENPKTNIGEQESKDGTAIPDWMKSLGWAEAGKSDETISSHPAQDERQDAEIKPADIPDWLQSLAPSDNEGMQEIPVVPPALDENQQRISPSEGHTEDKIDSLEKPDSVDLPDWLSGAENSLVAETAQTGSNPEAFEDGGKTGILPDISTPDEKKLPEWFDSEQNETIEPIKNGVTVDEFSPPTDDSNKNNIEVDWLQSLKETVIDNPIEPSADQFQPPTDGWIKEESLLDLNQPIISDQSDKVINPSETDLPDWLNENQPKLPPLDMQESDAPEWLEGLDASAEILPRTDEHSLEAGDLPDWLKEARENQMNDLDKSHLHSPEETAPEWLVQTPDPAEPEKKDSGLPYEKHLSSEQPNLSNSSTEIPGWLRSFDQPDKEIHAENIDVNSSGEVIDFRKTPIEDLSAWLKNLDTSKIQITEDVIDFEDPETHESTNPMDVGQDITSTLQSDSENTTTGQIDPLDTVLERKDTLISSKGSGKNNETFPTQIPEHILEKSSNLDELSNSDNVDVANVMPENQNGGASKPEPEKLSLEHSKKLRIEEDHLQQALNGLGDGDIHKAIENYQIMIRSGKYLQETIESIRDGLYRYPVDIGLWQVLGDALARNKQLKEALDAYTKAEELLR